MQTQLVLGCLALLGAPLPPSWAPPNAPHLLHAQLAASTPAAVQQLGGLCGWSTPHILQSSALERSDWLHVGADEEEPTLWWMAHTTRRAWLCRLLALLASEGSCAAIHPTAAKAVQRMVGIALLAAHAGGPGGCLSAARDAAKGMLAIQRTNHPLWCAYAELEANKGSAKVWCF